jgi:crossover junction endodeoxyribonuclease RusA
MRDEDAEFVDLLERTGQSPVRHPRPTERGVSVRFEMIGEPVAWQRVKVDTRGKRPRFYTAPEVENAEGKIAQAYVRASGKRRLDPDQLWGVELHFELSRSRQRKDVDNLAKIILDALNGWAWKDDRQVAKLGVTIRRDSEAPRTICRVYEISEG